VGVTVDFSKWTPRERPRRETMEGRLVRLEPLSAARHGDSLYAVTEGEADRFRYLFEPPPADRAAMQPWLDKAEASADPLWFTIIDKANDDIVGRQAFMRIDPAFGVIEIGSILWSGQMARTPLATEALYMFAKHAFDDLGYRRFEWKCDNRNEPSKRAALRFGFSHEGVFRQHMIVKGQNRDTAWFSMLDTEWPIIGQAFAEWLNTKNFDADGRQKTRLEEIRAGLAGRAG
jgi:RimJ/RimL family protein N-acetyltransferase